MTDFNRTLGRRYAPDPRDTQFPLEVSRLRAALRLERHWRVGPVLDQGSRPHCVGFGWYQFLVSAPVSGASRGLPTPAEIYFAAQKVDEWPGENYDGTSVRAGAKVLQRLGLLREYRWARSIGEVRDYILTRGPIVVGTDWFSGMSEPTWLDDRKRAGQRNDAYLEPTGTLEGGHAYMLCGYSRVRSAFRMVNSWGQSWGENGRAWLDYDVADYLLFRLNGEACSALETARMAA